MIPEWDGKRGLYDIMKGKVEERGGRGREGGGTFSSAPNFPDRVFSLVVCFGRIISKAFILYVWPGVDQVRGGSSREL